MSRVQLPVDLIEFLNAGKPLKYKADRCECGQVTLLPPGKHKLGEVTVHPSSLPDADDTDAPHVGVKGNGYYVVPAVNLVAECEDYEPEYILMWLPESEMYGTWDCDHHAITCFPKATWTDIAAKPLRYVNAQWDGPSRFAKPLVPWPRYPFERRRR